jgi:hypothetical protein
VARESHRSPCALVHPISTGEANLPAGSNTRPNHLGFVCSNILKISPLRQDTTWAGRSRRDTGAVSTTGTNIRKADGSQGNFFRTPTPSLETCRNRNLRHRVSGTF